LETQSRDGTIFVQVTNLVFLLISFSLDNLLDLKIENFVLPCFFESTVLCFLDTRGNI